MVSFAIVKKYYKLILSMLIVTALGFGLYFGLASACSSLTVSYNNFVEDYRYADAVITTELVSKETLASLENIPGLESYQPRLVSDTPVKTKAGDILDARLFSYSAEDYQDFYIRELDSLEGYPNVYIERGFANSNDIHCKDLIEIKLGEEYVNVAVGGIVSSPECLAMAKDEFSWTENPAFGFIFLSDKLLLSTDFYGQYNQINLYFNEDVNHEEILDRCQEALKDIDIHSAKTYENSLIKRILEINLDPFEALTDLVPTVFFIMMVIVSVLFMSSILSQYRHELGIMRAVGFYTKDIQKMISKLALEISIVGIVLGLVIGRILANISTAMFTDYFGIPRYEIVYGANKAILFGLILVIVGQLTAIYSVKSMGKIQAAEVLSREVNSNYVGSKFIDRVTRKLPKIGKFSLNTTLRKQKQFWISVVCMALSGAVIFISVAFARSKDAVVRELFDDRIHYDCQLFMSDKDEDPIDEIRSLPYVSKAEYMDYYQGNIDGEDVLINGVETDSELIGINVNLPDTGIVLTEKFADEHNIKIGDKVGLEGNILEVKGISKQYSAFTNYVSREQINNLGLETVHAMVVASNDVSALKKYAVEKQWLAYSLDTDVMYEGTIKTFRLYMVAVYILIIFGALAGLVVIQNVIQLNLADRKREIASLRSLGISIKEISKNWFSSSFLEYICSLIVSLPICIFFGKYALERLTVEIRIYPFVDVFLCLVLTAAIVLVYLILSHLLAVRSISKWDIAEIVKGKE